MRFSTIIFLVCSSHFLFAQYSEELVDIKYSTDQLVSIKVFPNIPYVDQMLGGVVVNTDNNSYTFTGQGSDSKLYTVDIASGDILYEVDVPQIQMLQFQSGSDELIGISKGNPSGIVSVASVNYKTGAFSNFPPIAILEDVTISTHNSAINQEDQLLYFIGSLSNSNNWSVIVVDITDGSFVKSFELSPAGESLAGLAYDADRKKLLGLLGLTPNGKSFVEIDPITETVTEIKKIPEIINTFGGHRYWAYNDTGDEFFIVGFDKNIDSFLFTLDGNDGTILHQTPYSHEIWIMINHSPLNLRYSHNTQQLLGLRTGPPLSPVSTSNINFSTDGLKITPNPVTAKQINISSIGGENIQEITIVNTNGSSVLSQTTINKNTFDLTLNQLPSGLYFLIGVAPNKIYRQSFVIQ